MIYRVRVVLQRFLLLMVIYFIMRSFYLAYNHKIYSEFGWGEVVAAFFMGFRFDAAAIVKLNGAFFLLWLLPFRAVHQGVWSRIVKVLYFLLNATFLVFNTVDTELVNFNGQRLTLNYFSLARDVENQAGQLIGYYWFVALFTLALIVGMVRFFPKVDLQRVQAASHSVFVRTLGTFFLILFFGLCVRGGLQNKPLRPAHAFRFSRGSLGNLALNSSFTIMQSVRSVDQKRFELVDFKTISADLNRDRTAHFARAWARPQNVVIIIMESFALEYIGRANKGRGYTPFLDEIANRSLFFENFFANGRRSIEAVPSLLASVPSLLDEAFLMSSFQGARILGLGEILKKNGYETAFFHGAENGSMFFDSFSARAGFEKYFGLQEYPHRDQDYDGYWGILDEPYFQYVSGQLNEFKKPFGAIIFSLSSHQPYPVPAKYKGRFPRGTLEIHESIGYADFSLREFFKNAATQPWYKDTLFVITGDHTQKSDIPEYSDTLGHYRIPLLLFHPSAHWPKVNTKSVGQHADVLPTILDVLNLPSSKLSHVGHSLFADDADAFVVNRVPTGFWYLSNQFFLEMDLKNQVTAFRHMNTRAKEPISLDQVDPKEISRFKSYLQYVVNGLMDNTLHSDRQEESIVSQ